MNRWLTNGFIALALVGGASACGVRAETTDAKPPAASGMPPFPPGPPGAFFGGPGFGGPFGGPGFGPPGPPGPWMMMAGRPPFGRDFSPQAHCLDAIAREAAHYAYLETRLNLSDAQRPLWQRVSDAVNSAAETQRKICASLPVKLDGKPPSLPQRLEREKQMLAARLDELSAVQPAIASLYESLSPDQRALIDPVPPARP
jgi:LTXXQ motif family protein